MTTHPAGTTAVTHVVFIIDSSGSMGEMRKEAIELINAQVTEVRNATHAGKATISLTTFGTESRPIVHYVGRSIDVLRPVSYENYRPDGMTPMYDAIGWTLERVEQELVRPELDYAVLVIVVTDGQENYSGKWQQGVPDEQRHRSYSAAEIRQSLQRLEQTGRWTFTILGTDQDIWKLREGEKMMQFQRGGRSMAFTKEGMKSASKDLSDATRRYMDKRASGKTRVDDFFGTDDPASSSQTPPSRP